MVSERDKAGWRDDDDDDDEDDDDDDDEIMENVPQGWFDAFLVTDCSYGRAWWSKTARERGKKKERREFCIARQSDATTKFEKGFGVCGYLFFVSSCRIFRRNKSSKQIGKITFSGESIKNNFVGNIPQGSPNNFWGSRIFLQ